jgi:hypothetical protein
MFPGDWPKKQAFWPDFDGEARSAHRRPWLRGKSIFRNLAAAQGKRGRPKKTKPRNLLEKLDKYQTETLNFIPPPTSSSVHYNGVKLVGL